MDIAIGLPGALPGRPAGSIAEWARRAERAGFSSLGTIGRIVFDCYEELVMLGVAAGATERIRLATTVLIGPVRETVLLAKQAATLDALSGGRLALGLGVGWRDDDFRATGAAGYHERGRRLDEQVALLRRTWTGTPPAEALDAVGPPPAREGGPEIWLGGAAPPALRRAGRLADAFIAMPGAEEQVRSHYGTVCEAAERAGRTPPRLVVTGYFALGDQERAVRNVDAYYRFGGQGFVDAMVSALLTSPAAIEGAIETGRKLGAAELFLWPQLDEVSEVDALADIALR